MRRSLSKSFRLLGAAVLTLSACSDSGGPSGNGAPALPPAASMQADLTFFSQPGAAADYGTAAVAGTSFVAAAFAVGVAQAATFLALALPAATFQAAISHDPVFENGAFHWRYTSAGSGYSYLVDLSAEPEGSNANWEMRVSSTTHTPQLNNFLWVSGRSTLAADEGEWHLFDASTPATLTEILSVDWTYESESDATLTLTNVRTSSPDVGDILEFSVDGNIKTVRFTDASAATVAVVQWNHVTHVGFIQAPTFNGGVRSCWNSNLENTACQ